jgi:hypothetical protein
MYTSAGIFFLAPNNPETVKNLKNVFEGFKAAAKFYSQV